MTGTFFIGIPLSHLFEKENHQQILTMPVFHHVKKVRNKHHNSLLVRI